VDCDAAVIGAGICGLAAALALERRSLRTVVLERHTPGSGASGRNAGYLMRGAAENYAAACRTYGRTRAGHLWRWSEKNLHGLRAEGIDDLPSYRAMPSCLVAFHEAELEELGQSLTLLREDGFAAEWIDRGEDSLWKSGRALGGLINPHDATVNPQELVRMLASRLRGGIYENQEVFEVVPEKDHVLIAAADLRIRAGRVMVCLNAYAGTLFPALASVVAPRRGQMLALAAPEVRLDYAYYADHGSEYFREAPAPPEGLVVIGGRRKYFAEAEIGLDDSPTDAVQTSIEEYASALFGKRYPVVARWAGIMGFSPDGLPLVGPIDEAEPRIWFCGGFTGHGMSLAFETARAAVASMLEGAENPFPLSRVGRQ